MRSKTAALALLTGLCLTLPVVVATAGETEVSRQLAEVRRATARYHDLAEAIADGYQPASPCVPHMGFHYLRSVAQDASDLDATSPNLLVYAPRPDGSLRLVAVEYASWDTASLFGQTFEPPHPGGPPFHTLHAWIWQANPAGTFTALNDRISCTP